MNQQIRRLAKTATALRAGTSTYFPITRLTSIKSLCKEPEMAAQFVFYLAERTLEKVHARPCPAYTDPADWTHYQTLITEAISLMRDYLQAPTEKNLSQLRSMLRKAEAVQAYTGERVWGHPLRTIHSNDVLVIEDALRCMTPPDAAPYWAYQTARDYSECYDPRYGTGLIPESLPMLEDIIGFWTNRLQSPIDV
jgi:hypothetical protein